MESETFVAAPSHRQSLFVTSFKDPSAVSGIPHTAVAQGMPMPSLNAVLPVNANTAHGANGDIHSNNPSVAVFPRYSAMASINRTDDVSASDNPNKEFPCRHLCGCKKRGNDKSLLAERRLCSSRGSRYDHEGNGSLHPYCTQACPANKFLKSTGEVHHQRTDSHSLTVPTSRPLSPASPVSSGSSPIYYSPMVTPIATMDAYYAAYHPMQIMPPISAASPNDLSPTITPYPSFNKQVATIKPDAACWMPSVPFTVSMTPPPHYQHHQQAVMSHPCHHHQQQQLSPPMVSRLVHPVIDTNKLQPPLGDFSRTLSPLTSPSSSPPITPRSAIVHEHHQETDEEDHTGKIVEEAKRSKHSDSEKSHLYHPSIRRPLHTRHRSSIIHRNTMIASSPAALSLDPAPSSSSPSPVSRKRSSDEYSHPIKRRAPLSHDFSYSLNKSYDHHADDHHDTDPDSDCVNALSFLAEAVSMLQ